MPVPNIPIIVTRAEPGASETVQRLHQLGYAAVRAPALTLHPRTDIALPPASTISGLVFTSANGVRAYASQRDDRTIASWCVGPATAYAAKQEGFSTVHESAGNAIDLAGFIASRSAPTDTPLLHVANAAAAGNLKRELESLGFAVQFAPLYEMRPAGHVPSVVTDLVEQNRPAIVLVHSAKGASAFASLIESHGLDIAALVAISEPASRPLANFAIDCTFIADAPNEDRLLRALGRAVATLSA